jgi:small subunit ribosomal protein S24e
MELELKKERETPLLSRKRYVFDLTFEGATPSRDKIRDAVAKKVNADRDLTIIKHVYNRYGAEKAKVFAHVYGTKEDMKRIEEPGTLKKHVKEKAAEAPKE